MTNSPANDNKGARTPACPICGRPRVAEHRPFCSRRCADVDLHHWLSAAYVISSREAAEEDGPSADDPLWRRPNESGAKT
jgi:endogenous inhibitor of DNA gyrase (YacG/DUF329 family)